MKKVIIMGLITFMAVILPFGLASAIQGVCSNCHTMHNSQNGDYEVVTYDGNGGFIEHVSTPQSQLLKASCIACHTGTAAESTSKVNARNAPIVLRLSCPTGQGGSITLAGGDFCFVAKGVGTPADSKGHNVKGISDIDAAIQNSKPPGWDLGATSGFTFGQVAAGAATWGFTEATQLTCDGIYGCHGKHDATGVTGAHHANPNVSATQVTSDPTTVGGSYRFLAGIRGLENVDWNFGETTSAHNEYYGVNDTSNRNQTNTTYANKNTISFSCAECHGYFHSRIDDTSTGSPWLRHPTDIMLPNSSEYASYNPNVSSTPRTYNLQAPVARPSFPVSNSSQVTPDTDGVVMCLSCHRAHGSPQADILRWDYSTMIAGPGNSPAPGTGCFVCHTTKD